MRFVLFTVEVKFKRSPFARVLFVLDFVTDIVPLSWLLLSSFTLIATISPVPTIPPVLPFAFDLLPEVEETALETEFVVPPPPPPVDSCLGLSVGFVPDWVLPPPP